MKIRKKGIFLVFQGSAYVGLDLIFNKNGHAWHHDVHMDAPQAYQTAMYVYISFLKSFRPPFDPPWPQPLAPNPLFLALPHIY